MAKKRRSKPAQKPIAKPARRDRHYMVYLALAVLTFAVFWQAGSFELTNYDDSGYITRNPPVLSGLNTESFNWAFTAYYQFNWHPLTWLSLMADSQIAKWMHREPGPKSADIYHVTSVAFHLANVLLLFQLLNRLTASRWRSTFVAALFAIHPLHVESVAWVTERKDVLSTFFLLLTMLAYTLYAARPDVKRYALVALAFALGLLSKPMLVTLPILVLLLDYWPIGREQGIGNRGQEASGARSISFLVLEKLPLFALAAASCVMTFRAQSAGGAVTGLGLLPIGVRLANAVVSSLTYIGKMFWPANLAAFYPHPNRSLPEWQIAASIAALIMITAAVCWFRWSGISNPGPSEVSNPGPSNRRQRSYLLVGWLWYVITLIPVSGIVQVGEIGMADRYTYVPLIGLFVMVVWGATDLFASRRFHARTLALAGAVVVLALAVRAHQQAGHWRNSIALWEHTIEITKRNPVAENNLADAFCKLNDYDSALPHLQRAIELRPRYANAHYGLGYILAMKSKWNEAVPHFRMAVQASPGRADYHGNLGIALANSGKPDEGISELQKAVDLDPTNAAIRRNLEQIAGSTTPHH